MALETASRMNAMQVFQVRIAKTFGGAFNDVKVLRSAFKAFDNVKVYNRADAIRSCRSAIHDFLQSGSSKFKFNDLSMTNIRYAVC